MSTCFLCWQEIGHKELISRCTKGCLDSSLEFLHRVGGQVLGWAAHGGGGFLNPVGI